jgi:beta-galactosidase/beta-glucuronidase
MLHFQASDYDTFVWANGHEVGRHRGGMTPFSCDLTGIAIPGEKVTLVVRARDNPRESMPSGKQSWIYENCDTHYARTTGIWQTVWLEPLPRRASLRRPKITPDAANGRFLIEQPIEGSQPGLRFRARLRDAQGVVAESTTRCAANFYPLLELTIPDGRAWPWSPENPHLYDVDLELLDEAGQIIDSAASYAGLRSVCIDGLAVKINGRKIFQRLVADQGFYPDGILTAPSDAALEQDIKLALAAGFNGARLHQKIFEERFLYHADRLGYLVWGEFSDWGLAGREAYRGWIQSADGTVQRNSHHNGADYPPTYITQWLEALQRDYNHPCIVGWCPLNETIGRIGEIITLHDDVMQGMFLAAKMYDPTRPVLDTSGHSHRIPEADIYDYHDYSQDPGLLAERYRDLAKSPYQYETARTESIHYRGQPYFLSEFGGIRWNPNTKPGEASWGYGKGPETLEGYYTTFSEMCRVLLENPNMFGYCFTQLTDVFQEQNGIYYFDRTSKFDIQRIRAAQQYPAAIEK